MFKSNAEKQCVAMSLCSIVYHQIRPVNIWNSHTKEYRRKLSISFFKIRDCMYNIIKIYEINCTFFLGKDAFVSFPMLTSEFPLPSRFIVCAVFVCNKGIK